MMVRNPTPAIEAPAPGAVGLDVEAFDGIVRAHQRRIYRVLLGMTRSAEDADVLTQETFVRAFERRRDFQGGASVETWLTRIAINLVRDRSRSRSWRFWRTLLCRDGEDAALAEAVPDDGADPVRELLDREDADAIGRAVRNLPARQRAAFTLRHVEELSLDEVARAMECEVGTVKSHLARATEAIRREVGHGRP